MKKRVGVRTWPALVALVVVVLLGVAMLALDLFVDDRTAKRTAALVDDSLPVIALVLVRVLRRQRALLALHLDSLDERTRELEAFAARTAHDLKGPLNPLSGYADLLRDNASPTVRELAVRIRRASDRMAGVIDNLLSLSVAGHPRPGTVAVRAMIDEVL